MSAFSPPARVRILLRGAALGLLAATCAAGMAQAAPSCEGLAGAKIADGVVESARPTAASDTIVLGGGMPGLPAGAAFCRVKLRLKPTPASDIQAEVWLPAAGAWNGKLLGGGNGGYGGSLAGPIIAMRGAVARGYVAAGTDMGHTVVSDIDASWALNQPEKVKDFGYRANHLTALAAKALSAAYYGSGPKLSYFHGCSDGGREALAEAQRFPEDYDAIAAGAPANPWTRLMSAFVWNSRAAAAAPLATSKLSVLTRAVMSQCDKLDGVQDGVLENPKACRFDPGVVQCKAGDHADCLTAAEVATARKIYAGPTTKAGRSIYPGFAPGGEAVGWDGWITGAKASQGRFGTEFYRYMVFGDPHWDAAGFDIDRDLKIAQSRQGKTLDTDNPDLSAFKARGGKLILYQGWADAAIPPQSTIDYYTAAKARTRGSDEMLRLFMVPGMSHCLLGPGPNVFDVLSTLDSWRSNWTAPERIVATKYDNDLFAYLGLPAKPVRTRPLCAYPKIARWNGSGSTDEAANFACVSAK
jgi:feruloyl esterase